MSPQPDSLAITFSSPATQRVSEELLLIEQEEWKPFTGYLTKGNMARYLANMLYGNTYAAAVDCGLVDGQAVAAIHVYPLREGVQYRLAATHGDLDGPFHDEYEVEETLHFSLEATASVRYPIARLLASDWLSSYSAEGVRVPGPAVTVSGRDLTAAAAVYGSLKIRYATNRHRYTLTVGARPEARENFYSAFVVGFPSGGRPVLCEFKPPPTAEELIKGGYECGLGFGGISVLEPYEWTKHPLRPPEATTHQRSILVDYCSQKILTDSTI